MVRLEERPPQFLKHYPEDVQQEKVVRFASRLADILYRLREVLGSAILFCFRPIQYVISHLAPPKKAAESTEVCDIPLSFSDSQQFAMDNKFYYMVKDEKIWYKPIAAHQDAPWKQFGNLDVPIVAVSADGENVVAVDDQKCVHYGKNSKINVTVDFDGPNWEATPDSKIEWTIKWFNMDFVAPILNKFKDPTLQVDKVRGFAISHKGPETMYYTDMAGKKHPDPLVGVTTLYVLSEDGTRLFFADPWLHNKFDNELTGPEEGRFVAESIAVSASSVFLLQRARDSDGKEINKMYTRYADFDSIGSNPALPGTYDIDNKTPLVRYLPAEGWLEQPPITLEGKARLTKEIYVLQTGRGQDHRQLRVIGTNSEGTSGYFYKNIYDTAWKFEVTGQPIPEEKFLAETVPHTGFQQGPKKAYDYTGSLSSSFQEPVELFLKKFSHEGLNERGLHTSVELALPNGMRLEFPLHARRGLRHLLGFDSGSKKLSWTLVVPKEYQQSQNTQVKAILKQLFNNKKSLKVRVDEHSDSIAISPEFFSRNKFTMQFRTRP
jgi:hypothetical protein